jgi:hypothetical protein
MHSYHPANKVSDVIRGAAAERAAVRRLQNAKQSKTTTRSDMGLTGEAQANNSM